MIDTGQILGKSGGRSGGIDLDLGILRLNITLTVGGIQSLSDALQQTLQQAEPLLTQNIEKVVDAVRQLGPDQLKNWAQQGGEQAQQAYHQLLHWLREAAARGQEQAKNLLHSLGEGMETAGEKMQSAASEDTDVRH